MAVFFQLHTYYITAIENKNLIGKSTRNLTSTLMPF